jgi:hypothetical protein
MSLLRTSAFLFMPLHTVFTNGSFAEDALKRRAVMRVMDRVLANTAVVIALSQCLPKAKAVSRFVP